MDGTSARENVKISGCSSVTEDERDGQSVERHPLITETAQLRSDHGRDEPSVERHGPARGGHERAWHLVAGYERAASPTSLYEGAPHPISGYERLPVDRAHTMKDFEKQITDLKKENFNLKLRIYFLEERVQRRCETSGDELQRMNIELKVEVESLKHHYQEKHHLLLRASKAMESLAGEQQLAVQRMQGEHLQRMQDLEGAHSRTAHLLEQEKAELEKMCLLLEQERVQRFTSEERLRSKSVEILEERDWIIRCLNETVHSKDALIAQLEKQITSMMAPADRTSDLERDGEDLLSPPKATCDGDCVDGKQDVIEWQRKIKEMDNLIHELQQKLEANKAGEKNSLKRDKAIQGLTLALKKKTSQNDKLLSEIQNLNAALAKAREVAQEVQLQSIKENVHPDYRRLIFTLQAEQDLYNRLLKFERGSGSLQKELEAIAMLRRWLEENIQANQELRKIMEAQIMARYAGDDSMSFLGDQTSYLSICLDHLDQNENFFASGLHGRATFKNNMDVLRKEAVTQTQSEFSASSGGRSKPQLDHKSDLSFNESSTGRGESGGNDGSPTKNRRGTVSSATQTEPEAFTEKSIPVDVHSYPVENTELMWTLLDGELNVPSQRHPHKPCNDTREIQSPKQGEFFNNHSLNAKKSRLPVLLKSSLNTKLKTDAVLTPAEESDDSGPEPSQIENRRLELLKCDENEIESYEESKDLANENRIPELNNPGQEQRDPAEQAAHKYLKPAEREIRTLKENEELLRCEESELYNSKQRETTERAFKELQAENHRVSEQLTRAQKEIETLKDLIKHRNALHDLSGAIKEQREFTDQEQCAENHRVSEQLTLAQKEIETLKDLRIKHKNALPDLSGAIKTQRESTDQEQRAENQQLSEQLTLAQKEIETLKDLINHLEHSYVLSGAIKEQRESTDQEQRAENHRLSEQLTLAQKEIETLKDLIKHKNALHDLSGAIKEQRESTDQEQCAENHRVSEQLTLAQKETETLKDLIKHKNALHDLSGAIKEQRESTDQELQAENHQLSEQLTLAQKEIETLKDLIKHKNALHDLSGAIKEQRESTDQEQCSENHRVSEQLTQAQKEIKNFKHKDPIPDASSSSKVHMESTDLPLHEELNVDNHSLSEHLEEAEIEIETLKGIEELLRCKSSELDLNNCKDEQRKSPEPTLQKELQAENYRLSEELKTAQMEIGAFIKHKDIVPDSPGFKVQVESTDQALQKELQAENHRLSEQLKTALMEIEKLQAERRSIGSSDDSLKLHGSDADDNLSEQSFLDKTITNSIHINEVDATSDFGDEVCRPNVDSQNAVALRCHHDNHCAECANNRGSLSLSTSNSKRASTMHTSPKFSKVSCSGRSFEDTTSLSKYDLLVQSQARELSLQRQKIKESHNLSVICSKKFYNILKAFENLFPVTALDSNMTLGFQEQITQTVEWLKELEYKLSDALYEEEDAYSDHSVDSLLHTPSRLVPGHRMWADKHGCHVLGLVEDYNALRKQILEARNVLQEMESFIDHGVQTAVLNMTEHFGNIFFEKLTRAKQSLEDAGCLMKLLWRVSLPLQIHSQYSITQEEGASLEITRLRKRVLEQEKLLSGMVKRVYSKNQMKEDIEKLILNQLAMTHDILKRAKGNLEVQVVDKLH